MLKINQRDAAWCINSHQTCVSGARHPLSSPALIDGDRAIGVSMLDCKHSHHQPQIRVSSPKTGLFTSPIWWHLMVGYAWCSSMFCCGLGWQQGPWNRFRHNLMKLVLEIWNACKTTDIQSQELTRDGRLLYANVLSSFPVMHPIPQEQLPFLGYIMLYHIFAILWM